MDAADLYLDLLKGCLTRSLFLDEQDTQVNNLGRVARRVWAAYKRRYRGRSDWRIVEPLRVSAQDRAEGTDWPDHGETMIGHKRLDNIQHCVTSVLEDDVPGGLIETGVWRG